MASEAIARPTLHEIAAMPFPVSRDTMRKHYNKDWGKPVPADGMIRKFAVRIDVTVPTTETYQVEAFTAGEAEEEALALAAVEHGPDADFDVREVSERGK